METLSNNDPPRPISDKPITKQRLKEKKNTKGKVTQTK